VSEREIEIDQLADGSFAATFDERYPAAAVTSWADVRTLRARHRQQDHWAPGAYDAFVAAYGHPFEHWWTALAPEVRDALVADPSGRVPAAYADAVKRSLRSEPGRDGLRLDGSSFTPEVREFLATKATKV
jgi:hypothetical protein